MKIKFRDILQCAEGSLKGLLAQVTAVTDSEIELLSRDKDGSTHTFKVTESDLRSRLWLHTGGIAISGPKPKSISEPAAAPVSESVGGSEAEAPGSSDAAPVSDSPPPPLNEGEVEDLLKPLPPTTKAVPIPNWNMDDPQPEPEPEPVVNTVRPATPPERIRYSAKVTNGKGQETLVEYSLKKDVRPERFSGIPIKLSKKFLEDVGPFTASNFTPLP